MNSLQRSLIRTRQHGTSAGVNRRQILPAPFAGLNTTDPLPSTRETYATKLVNWFPDEGRLVTRPGSTEYVNIPGEAGEIGTLHTWINGTASKFFAFSPNAVWDITDPASPTKVVSSGVSSSRWVGVNMNGNSIFVNGVDTPLRVDMDGNFVEHGFTGEGLTPSRLSFVTVHRGSLFFVERDSSDFWYGGINSVTGTLSKFPLGSVTPEGGNLSCIGNITIDAGDGADDLLVFAMDRGQVLPNSGGDPESDAWNLNGVFNFSPVVGSKPFVKFGSDLVAITRGGYIPLYRYLASGGKAASLVALSNKIDPTVKSLIRLYDGDPGWEAIYYDEADWLVFNIGGYGGGGGLQHVMNTKTGAWTTFSGLNALCWGEHANRIYFGSEGGRVVEANRGQKDGDVQIRCVGQTANNYLGSTLDKMIKGIRPHFVARSSNASIRIGLVHDYAELPAYQHSFSLTGGGTQWDADEWDEFQWGSGEQVFRDFIDVGDPLGSAVAVYVDAVIDGGTVEWITTDLDFEVLRNTYRSTG